MGVGGQRLHPHTGIDFKANRGDPVLAAADGDVVSASHFEDVGNAVVIGHLRSPDGYAYYTAYLHLDDVQVKFGEEVHRGDPIGRAGATGVTSAGKVHLHFQLCTFACLAGTEDGNFKGVEDPLRFSAGCYDQSRVYDDGNRLVLTYPIECAPKH